MGSEREDELALGEAKNLSKKLEKESGDISSEIPPLKLTLSEI